MDDAEEYLNEYATTDEEDDENYDDSDEEVQNFRFYFYIHRNVFVFFLHSEINQIINLNLKITYIQRQFIFHLFIVLISEKIKILPFEFLPPIKYIVRCIHMICIIFLVKNK